MPDTPFHPQKSSTSDLIIQPFHHFSIGLFIPVKLLQGITGLGIQIIGHAILHCSQRIRQLVQVHIVFINHIYFPGHTVDSGK